MNRRFFIYSAIYFLIFLFSIPLVKIRHLMSGLFSLPPLAQQSLQIIIDIADIIFPNDIIIPGARVLGIESFLILQLRDDYYMQTRNALSRICTYFQFRALTLYNKNFHSLSSPLKEQLITDFISNPPLTVYRSAYDDFNHLVDICIEGCFSSSVHGGNHGDVAWNIFQDSFKKEWFNV